MTTRPVAVIALFLSAIIPGLAASGQDANARTVSFTDAVCGRIPPVPVTFEMPGGFESRAAGKSADGGCLWGTKDDLDRITADPTQGDFTSLTRGAFRARMSINVVYGTQSGEFDQTDGTGEKGMRRGIEAQGAKVVQWKKDTTGGLPSLQVIADVGKSRVYMLYLGNTQFISNTLLVNYYPPAKRTSADEQVWARFVAGIKKAAAAPR